MNYKLKLISHACILLDLGDIKLITDPWLFGECFNDGWSLKQKDLTIEKITEEEINSITHLWISHEHPDHFHIPSLKFLLSKIKDISNIEIILNKLKQDNNIQSLSLNLYHSKSNQ